MTNQDDYWTNTFSTDKAASFRATHEVRRISGHALTQFFAEVNAPLWMVADGAGIDGLAERLEGSGLEHHSLFASAQFENMAAAAPWLIAVDYDEELTHLMLNEDCDHHWSLWKSGLLLCSSATGAALAHHLRRLVLRQLDGKRRAFHRFWEPSTIFDYFHSLMFLPDRATQMFQNGSATIDAIFAYEYRYKRSVLVQRGELREARPFQTDLHPKEVEALLAAVLRPFAIGMATDLLQSHAGIVGHLEALDLEDALTESCVRLHGHGFRDVDLMRELALQDIWQGGPFENADMELYEICRSDIDEWTKYAALGRRIAALA